MATEPLADGPHDDPKAAESAALRAERDSLARRCAAAERRIEELTAQLDAAQRRIEQDEEAAAASLSLFEGGTATNQPTGGDGTDARVIPVVLGATAVVSGMVVLLSFLNGNLFSIFGIAMIAITAALAWGAAATRVEPVSVSITHGVVHVEKGDSKYRFDLNHEDTRVEQQGRPEDPEWRITFARRYTGPIHVDASMVDPVRFAAEVKQYRPRL